MAEGASAQHLAFPVATDRRGFATDSDEKKA
jgi:hypothetical protein